MSLTRERGREKRHILANISVLEPSPESVRGNTPSPSVLEAGGAGGSSQCTEVEC